MCEYMEQQGGRKDLLPCCLGAGRILPAPVRQIYGWIDDMKKCGWRILCAGRALFIAKPAGSA